MLLEVSDGVPSAMALSVPMGDSDGDPEAQARAFLVEFAELFQIDDPDTLSVMSIDGDEHGTSVRFRQTVRDLPVFNGSLSVLVDKGVVYQFSGRYLPTAQLEPPKLTAEEAFAVWFSNNGVLKGPEVTSQHKMGITIVWLSLIHI